MNIDALLSPGVDSSEQQRKAVDRDASRASRQDAARNGRHPQRPKAVTSSSAIAISTHSAHGSNRSSPFASPALPVARSNRRPTVGRPTSTPRVATLADRASARNRPPPGRTFSADSVYVSRQQDSPALSGLRHRSVSRLSGTQPSVDFIMAEASASTPEPRSVESGALSQAHSQEVTDLLSYLALAENSYSYESHVRLVNLLHHGFRSHIHSGNAAASYGLLSELRQARDAMDTRFAVGEALWADWLADEVLLADTADDRIRVTELCQRAVQDEPTSARLWLIYTDWISSNHAGCYGLASAVDLPVLGDADREMCRELFTSDMVLTVLEQAASATQWRINDSHQLWNRYADLLLQRLSLNPRPADVDRLRDAFVRRLQIPHIAWADTQQTLWQLVSKFDHDRWEAIMDDANQRAGQARKQMSMRETHESNLRRFADADDREAEANEFSNYLQWERRHAGKGGVSFAYELRCALYERALLRFPTYHEWWLDYIDFVTVSKPSDPVLTLIERATRHCPWSGDLWARRILRSDVEGKPREEIEATKHRATNSGLLQVGGLEELLKVLQQWCSYLRRYAFSQDGAEDDRDVAELGIIAALDDIRQAGIRLYGSEFKGDPLYRLEKVQIKFLLEARRVQDARDVWRSLIPLKRDSADFWLAYYTWEIWLWGCERLTDPKRVEVAATRPHIATATAQEALSQHNLDWPEKVLDMYLNHFQQHESGERLQAALVDAREFAKGVAARRAREAETAAAQQVAAQQTVDSNPRLEGAEGDDADLNDKRKREDEPSVNGYSNKKLKTDATALAVNDSPEDPQLEPLTNRFKRDREHNTITVKGLPTDVSELDIKKFFRDVGVPLSISVVPDKSSNCATATVEFGTHEEILMAKTRNGKLLNGHEVQIQSGTQLTLYVANYPSEYDEEAIRRLFETYGEITSVRFPSLKFNNRRRFCYVTFVTAEMAAAAAAALDDKVLDGRHRLLAKISDPDAKKQRSGAQSEGRELFVKNLEREAPEQEIQAFFERYGTVTSINLVKLVNGKRTGTAFVVFSSADEANAALDANNKPFHDRILHVELSLAKGRAAPLDRARKQEFAIRHSESASPEPSSTSQRNGRRASSTTAPAKSPQSVVHQDESYKTIRERKAAILNLPDTVNESRVRAAMEQYGSLVKIQMRRVDNGAIVEFADVKAAFNVRHGVDCSSLGPDVRTGDVEELLHLARNQQNTTTSNTLAPPVAVSRPAQRGATGRRGGLGLKRGGSAFGASGRGSGVPEKGADTGKKTNAQFRNMFEQSRAGDQQTSDEMQGDPRDSTGR